MASLSHEYTSRNICFATLATALACCASEDNRHTRARILPV